jgi:predicted GNAT family N-acyltransferase
MNLNGYDCGLPVSQQSISIPEIFKDAMTVREAVFVREQGVPLAMEADADDARSCHWVIYDHAPDQPEAVPAGTVRIVPFPHDPHPIPDSSWDVEESGASPILTSNSPPYIVDRVTSLHDGKEPYIKFGRLAVLKKFRGRKLGDLLISSAIEWAKKSPDYFSPSPSKPSSSNEELELDTYRTTWNGLICAHVQEYVANAWAKWGFVVDDGMGKWNEGGIPHVGMFMRIDISRTATDDVVEL